MKFEKCMIPFRVAGVYNSVHPEKDYKGDDYFVTEARDHLELTLEGIIGNRHYGFTTVSGGRMKKMYEPGTVVRNNRQWLATSPADIAYIAGNLGTEGKLTPELLGVDLLLERIDGLSSLPSMSYLVFSPDQNFEPKRPENVTLVVYAQALPCVVAGKALVEPLQDPSLQSRFPAAALVDKDGGKISR